MPEPILKLDIPGASEAQLLLGLSAAATVFATLGVTSYEAAAGAFAREGWDMRGCPKDDDSFTDAHSRAAVAWDEAGKAAEQACCEGWGDAPATPRGLWLDITRVTITP